MLGWSHYLVCCGLLDEADCFDITLLGDSTGNRVQIGFFQVPEPLYVLPYVEIALVVGVWDHSAESPERAMDAHRISVAFRKHWTRFYDGIYTGLADDE
jgi:hypothetical protein